MEIIIPKYLKEYFSQLEQQYGIRLSDGQKRWYTMKFTELGDDIRQEYPSTPDESFMGSTEGFWYLKELNQAREDGRITRVPWQPECMVQTAWDIGYKDPTAIWFYQLLPSGAIHIIYYYENSGEGLSHYVAHINTLRFRDFIEMHHLPHDAAAHEKGSGLSYEKQFMEMGLACNVLKRYNASKTTFMSEVQRTRNIINRCYFDEENCAEGIRSLECYRKKWNETMCCYTSEPVHDFASHGADSFRYLAQAVELKARKPTSLGMEEERRKIQKARRMRI